MVGALVAGYKTYQVKVLQLCTENILHPHQDQDFTFPIAPSAVVTALFFFFLSSTKSLDLFNSQ